MPGEVGPKVTLVRRGLRLLVIFVALISLFVLALTAVFALPQHRIKSNLRSSVQLLRSEGLYPRLALGNNTYRLDNYDDAVWLDMNIVTQPGGPLVNAMGMYRGAFHNNDTIAALDHDLSQPREAPAAYAYYWHGYQLFLRPALVFLTYGEIRYLNMLLMGLLGAIVALVAARKADSLAAGAFAFALMLGGFWSVPLTINYSSVAYLMLVGSLVVLLWADKPSFRVFGVEAFFVLGMLTAFFDNLTNPLITLGVPLVFALIVLARHAPQDGPWSDTVFSAKVSLAWAVGYVASWVSKWFIGAAVLKWDVVGAGLAQFMFRAGHSDAAPRHLDSVLMNLWGLFPLIRPGRPAGVVLPLLSVVLLAALLIWFRRPQVRIARRLPLLGVALLPFVYYIVGSNHTWIHNWITYRTLVITAFAVIYFALAPVDFERVGRRLGLAGAASSQGGAGTESG